MPASKLSIVERQVDDVTILALSGEMLLDDGDLAYGRRIDEVIAAGRVKILLDLADLSYIDSSGVGMMAATLKAVRARHGDIRLLRVSTKGQRILSLLKLRSLFELFDDEAMALKSFKWRPGF
ncbi:MAG TPA: STAS domain-containing protein [Vicinamibacterales bacterium]|nr:STAS domain-containing protein [Vicinamibacterales bacterium]